MDKPSYPYSEAVMGVPWKPLPNMTLWSIAGWMSQAHGTERQATAFGGYFIVDDETGRLEGQLIDPNGVCKINGELQENILYFTRSYATSTRGFDLVDLPPLTHFRFDKKGDVWLGSAQNRVGGECSISPAIHNAGGIAVGDPLH